MVFGDSLERPRWHTLTPSSLHCRSATKTMSLLSWGRAETEKQLPPSPGTLPHIWLCRGTVLPTLASFPACPLKEKGYLASKHCRCLHPHPWSPGRLCVPTFIRQ